MNEYIIKVFIVWIIIQTFLTACIKENIKLQTDEEKKTF